MNKPKSHRPRAGFTLVEMLVTVVVTLLVLISLVSIFQWVGENVTSGKAAIEMQGALRGAATRLLQDLEGVTVPLRSWPSDGAGSGYFEYGEGVGRDSTAGSNQTILGDRDDYLAFTARSMSEPFRGRLFTIPSPSPVPLPSHIQSDIAEIIWWVQWEDLNGDSQVAPAELVLRRRVLLVNPSVTDDGIVFQGVFSASDLRRVRDTFLAFRNLCDLSVRYEIYTNLGSYYVRVRANSLQDLTRRERRSCRVGDPTVVEGFGNRYLRDNPNNPSAAVTAQAVNGSSYDFPFALIRNTIVASDGAEVITRNHDNVLSLNRLAKTDLRGISWASFPDCTGEDVILSGVMGFDVKAFDPFVPVIEEPTTKLALLPGDYAGPPGSGATGGYDPSGTVVGRGGFVDLYFSHDTTAGGYGVTTLSAPYNGTSPSPLPYFYGIGGASLPATYCTWSTHYESNGVDENRDGVADAATNGLDDDGANGTDDAGERDTSPPYPVPLRGLQVRIRIYDLDSRQVRQQTVTADFTPD